MLTPQVPENGGKRGYGTERPEGGKSEKKIFAGAGKQFGKGKKGKPNLFLRIWGKGRKKKEGRD